MARASVSYREPLVDEIDENEVATYDFPLARAVVDDICTHLDTPDIVTLCQKVVYCINNTASRRRTLRLLST